MKTFHSQWQAPVWKPLRRTSRVFVVSVAGGAVVLSVCWFVFFSGVFAVHSMTIEGNRELSIETLQSYAQGKLAEWNGIGSRKTVPLFFVDEQRLAKEVKEQFFLEDAVVTKTYPNVLRLLVKERQRSGIFVVGSDAFLVDSQGMILKSASDDERLYALHQISDHKPADIHRPPVFTTDQTDISTSTVQLVPDEQMQRWLKIAYDLRGLYLPYTHFYIDRLSSRSLGIGLEQKVILRIDIEQPLPPQIEAYKRFNEFKPRDVDIKEYIDVRTPEKVYVK